MYYARLTAGCVANKSRKVEVMSITLRPVRSDDEPFLYELYCGTRNEDLAFGGLDSPQQEILLRMQFVAQHRTYEAQYPRADHDIILLEGSPVGRVMVERGDEEIRGVDIALLPGYRSAGIGGAIIQDLL